MGSTESGTGDFSIGSIVWVRRRNGSWWPGKIVGPEELSASHLTSPRSGTPVKLLGREDASVDWYNLEKSKRVKAFRCGEFDECIERAESSQGMPIKKREKYARREDAILHALDLEKELLRKQGKIGITSDCADSRSSSGGKNGLVMSTESLRNDNLDSQNSKQNQLASRLDVFHNNEIIGGPLSSQIFKEGNQLSEEEDIYDVIPRMRGLQDFGLRITPSMRKLSSSIPSNGSREPTIDTSAQSLLHDDLKTGSMSHINGNDSLGKRKRSYEGFSEEFLAKRRDKRHPLVQVLQSSAKLAVSDSLQPDSAIISNSTSGEKQMGVNCGAKRSRCAYLPTGSSESLDYKAMSESDNEMSTSQIRATRHPNSLIVENISGFREDESDTSKTDSSDSESDYSETEPEMDLLSDAAVPTEPGVSSLESYELLDHQSLGSEEPYESALSGDTSHLYSHDLISASEAVSKWQLKGKRNIRNINKRSLDAADGKTSIYGAYSEDKDFRTEMIGLDNGYSVTPRATLKGRNSFGHNMINWNDCIWEDSPVFTGYWETRKERFNPVYAGRLQFGGRSRSMLMDVDLKVQASYQKAPVPIVSLTSKLNGKAIIGHPIKIEAMEDGSTSTLLSTVDNFGNEKIENYGNESLPQAWRTARRTANFRVPRPHLTIMDGDESAYDLPFLDRESKLPFKKSNVGNFIHKAGLVRKNTLQHTGISPYGKLQKASKKVCSSSSQKTRTLSSIPNEHNFSNKRIQVSSCRQMDGPIKPESLGPTRVAYIPVKLVFSRLLEKINRPPL